MHFVCKRDGITDRQTDRQTDKRTDGQTDDPITRCPRRTFQAGGIKSIWMVLLISWTLECSCFHCSFFTVLITTSDMHMNGTTQSLFLFTGVFTVHQIKYYGQSHTYSITVFFLLTSSTTHLQTDFVNQTISISTKQSCSYKCIMNLGIFFGLYLIQFGLENQIFHIEFPKCNFCEYFKYAVLLLHKVKKNCNFLYILFWIMLQMFLMQQNYLSKSWSKNKKIITSYDLHVNVSTMLN